MSQLLNVWPIKEKNIPTTANSSIRAHNTSNNLTNDSVRAVGSKIKKEMLEEVFGINTIKPPPIVTPTAAINTKKAMAIPA